MRKKLVERYMKTLALLISSALDDMVSLEEVDLR